MGKAIPCGARIHGCPFVFGLMISLVSFVWGARCWSADALPQIVADPSRRTLVSCKLPDQTRKAGKGEFIAFPGPVRRMEGSACKDQGGTYKLDAAQSGNTSKATLKGRRQRNAAPDAVVGGEVGSGVRAPGF
jgi:hypothetical protein